MQRGMSVISIHASLAGGDIYNLSSYGRQTYFNPRLPRGRRLYLRKSRADYEAISIHASLAGGDSIRRLMFTSSKRFQSTPPSREATAPMLSLPVENANFNPRLPRGRRQFFEYSQFIARSISIHASLAGGDAPQAAAHHAEYEISIHASLAGGDQSVFQNIHPPSIFQSTPPSREATVYDEAVKKGLLISIHASLAGGDLRDAAFRAARPISIHASLAGGDDGPRPEAQRVLPISIHASLAGGDYASLA